MRIAAYHKSCAVPFLAGPGSPVPGVPANAMYSAAQHGFDANNLNFGMQQGPYVVGAPPGYMSLHHAMAALNVQEEVRTLFLTG